MCIAIPNKQSIFFVETTQDRLLVLYQRNRKQLFLKLNNIQRYVKDSLNLILFKEICVSELLWYENYYVSFIKHGMFVGIDVHVWCYVGCLGVHVYSLYYERMVMYIGSSIFCGVELGIKYEAFSDLLGYCFVFIKHSPLLELACSTVNYLLFQ